MAGSKKDAEKQRIRDLEEKIKRLEEKLEAKGENSEGAAGDILREVGGKLGLGGLIKALGKSPAFQERLKAIDEEVERRLREEPLKRVDEERGRRPYTRSSFSVRTLADREPVVKREEGVRRMKREAIKEPTVDIFEEEDHIKVIAELPGVEEKDIKLHIEGDRLTIATDVPHHRYRQEVTLPYPPKGDPKTSYKNGILEVRFERGDGHD